MEKVRASVEKYGVASDVDIEGVVDRESLDLGIGEKGFESIPSLVQGRIYKYTPEEDTEITFDMYCIGMDTDTSTSIESYFIGGTPVVTGWADYVNLTTRNKFRITILFTNDAGVTDASDTVNGGTTDTYAARRYSFADSFITSVKPSFTDGILKLSITAKVPPYDADGNSNIKYQTLDGASTSSLDALAAYSGTVKF